MNKTCAIEVKEEEALPTTNAELSHALKNSFGWSWPPFGSSSCDLPSVVLEYFWKSSVALQRRLLRFGVDRQRAITNPKHKEEFYRATWEIRWLLVVERMRFAEGMLEADAQALWADNGQSELCWLWLVDGQCIENCGRPAALGLRATHPLQEAGPHPPTDPHAEQHTFGLIAGQAIPLVFQGRPSQRHGISFSRRPLPTTKLPPTIGTLGVIWLEEQPDRGRQRILFIKTISDKQLALFVWPQFPEHHWRTWSDQLPETPKIPVGKDEVVQLCDGDRLILFTSNYRSHRVHIDLQISISVHWANDSTDNTTTTTRQEKIGSDDQNNEWPNPSERYPHCLIRPIMYPKGFEVKQAGEGWGPVVATNEGEVEAEETPVCSDNPNQDDGKEEPEDQPTPPHPAEPLTPPSEQVLPVFKDVPATPRLPKRTPDPGPRPKRKSARLNPDHFSR